MQRPTYGRSMERRAIYTQRDETYFLHGGSIYDLFESDRDFVVSGIAPMMDCVIPVTDFFGMKHRAHRVSFVRTERSVANINVPEKHIIVGTYTDRPMPNYWIDAMHSGHFYWNGKWYDFCEEFRNHGFSIESTDRPINPFERPEELS